MHVDLLEKFVVNLIIIIIKDYNFVTIIANEFQHFNIISLSIA